MNWRNEKMISIVVMTYQSSKFIIEALESIKNQTWGNLELIISDDASTDNTIELCNAFVTNNKSRFINSIIITSKVNTGIPSNYNRGIRAASGEWIKFVDADDVLLHNCVMNNINYIERYPNAKFIISDLIEINENSKVIKDKFINKGMQYLIKKQSHKEQLKAYARFPFFINSPSFFVMRSLLERIGYCDEEFRIYEDITMVIRTLIEGNKIYYLNKQTVKYRIHSKSISRSASAIERRKEEEYMIFKKYREKYLNKNNPIDFSVLYEVWLLHKYKGVNGMKGLTILNKFSLFYRYLKIKGVHNR